MLESILQVNTEFFKLFHGYKVTVGGSLVTIPSRYAKKSSKDYVEESANQIYPCISTWDYTPTFKEEWFLDMKEYVDGISADGETAFLYRTPLWMQFVYDVSVVSKEYKEFVAIKNSFMKNFYTQPRFIFNKKLTGDDEVGDIVPYKIRATDIPRNDGVYEVNFEFTLSAWLYLVDPKEVELIKNIIINLTQQ